MTLEDQMIWDHIGRETRRRTNPTLLSLIGAVFDQRAGFVLAHISGAQDARDAAIMYGIAIAPKTRRIVYAGKCQMVPVSAPRLLELWRANLDSIKSTSHNGD